MTAPWNYSLPTTLEVGGGEKAIRTDYRVALDCFLALTDAELDSFNRAMELLEILYVDEIAPADWQEAVNKALWFLNGGEELKEKKEPQLVSWTQDFAMIASPISKNIGQDIRGMEHLHWWSFLSAYMAIGDCLFAQVVSIRSKLAHGKKLDKQDREFLRRNRDIIIIQKPLTDSEQEILKEWV
jgi:hypothetical protein